jgi:CRISPR/Cas system CSM-associated protein Csm3 (group 7 of RAMP superfamily)
MAQNEVEVRYTLTFLSDWHAGSGLSIGAKADASVIKDANGLPFLPGKTIKGLLKDALMDIMEAQPTRVNCSDILELFGGVLGRDCLDAEVKTHNEETTNGRLFFSNANFEFDLSDSENAHLKEYLYRTQASTAINERGTAIKGSLRVIETTIPLELYGFISQREAFSEHTLNLLDMAMRWTRHIGQNRNRGLGRCRFERIKS